MSVSSPYLVMAIPPMCVVEVFGPVEADSDLPWQSTF